MFQSFKKDFFWALLLSQQNGKLASRASSLHPSLLYIDPEGFADDPEGFAHLQP